MTWQPSNEKCPICGHSGFVGQSFCPQCGNTVPAKQGALDDPTVVNPLLSNPYEDQSPSVPP